MRNEIHDTKMDLVVSTENDVEDHLSGDEFAGVGIDVSALQKALGARRVPCGHG